MATLVEVATPDDERLRDYVRLRDVQLRTSLEAEHGLFIAEGEKVIRRAIAAGHPPRSFLMAPRWVESMADVLDQVPDAVCFVAPEGVVEEITGFHVHRGALASLQRAAVPSAAEVIRGTRRVVVLEDLVDHTNVGAIFRSAAALGWEAVLLSPRCADPLYRRSIKVSMGAVFALPYARMDRWSDGPGLLRDAGFEVMALTPGADAVDLDDVGGPERVAVLVGTEGAGLSSRWMAESHHRIRIPMSAGVDSLNVGAAAAIALYVLRPRG